jgi:hypothetical protein
MQETRRMEGLGLDRRGVSHAPLKIIYMYICAYVNIIYL